MLNAGSILRDRYRIESFLGRGGMADVYLALDMRRQVQVAVKVLREDLAEDPEFVQRFRREAEALAQLEHPFIVRFYSFERQGITAYIVMDYVSGTALRTQIMEADGPMSLDDVTRILHQVGSALQYAHNEGYIHRDIKPGNILIREDGTALLSDFGIARLAEASTMTMGPIGAPAYMSPEQIQGRELTEQTDIYSLGIVLYEMTTGRRPFTGDGSTGTGSLSRMKYIQQQHLQAQPPYPRDLNPALSPGAARVIMDALAKRQEARWPTVMSMVGAWERAVDLSPHLPVTDRTRDSQPDIVPLPPPVKPTWSDSEEPVQKRKISPWLAVAGSVVLAIVVLALLRLLLPTEASVPTVIPTEAGGQISPADVTATAVVTADVEATAVVMAASFLTATTEAEQTLEALVSERAQATTEFISGTATMEAIIQATISTQPDATTQRESASTPTTRPRATSTPSLPYARIASRDSLNVRNGPGTTYGKKTQLQPGASVIITGQNGVWWQVRLPNGQKGWVHKNYVDASGPLSGVPAVSAPAPATPKNTPKPSAPAQGTLANSRSGFSGSQGANGWQYQMEESRGSGVFKEMPKFDGTCWRTGTWETSVRICAGGAVHPGESTRIAYRWRSPVSGRLTIKTHAHKIDTSCGEGINVGTFKVTEGYSPGLLGEFNISGGDSSGRTSTFTENFNKGESVLVIVDIGRNSQCDESRIFIDIY